MSISGPVSRGFGVPRGQRTAASILALGATAVATLMLLASFLAGFVILTGCTDDYNCSSEWCSPCRTTSTWLTVGTIAEGVLVVVSIVLLVLAIKWRRPGLVAAAAVIVMALAVGILIGTSRAADDSYCHFNDLTCAT
jgi:hypothetical protein